MPQGPDETTPPLQTLVIQLHDAILSGAVTSATYGIFIEGLCQLHGHERAHVELAYWITHHLTPANQILVRNGRSGGDPG